MYKNIEFELHGLEKICATSLNEVHEPVCSLEPAPIVALTAAEVSQVKRRLIGKVLTIENEEAIRRYVQLHQYALVSLMDKVLEHSVGGAAVDCYEELVKLLSFLQDHFPDYFNENAMAPANDILNLHRDVDESYRSLADGFRNGGADPAIVAMVLYPLMKLKTDDLARISFSRIRHITYILRHGQKIVDCGCRDEEMSRQLFQLLVYLNYNSKKTFLQVTEYIRKLVKKNQNRSDKVKSLSYLLKEVNQTTVKPGTGYHTSMPSLKSQIVIYITEELNYLGILSNNPSSPDGDARSTTPFKIKLDLSVAQLACILKLFTESGIITNANTTALIRFVAHHCETKRAGKISSESLRIRFYDIEASTQRNVQDMLTNLIKRTTTS